MRLRRTQFSMKNLSSLSALVAAVVVSALPSSARAEGPGNADERALRYASPQRFALEFRLGTYNPEVDSEPSLGGKTPFATTFGEKPPRFLPSVEFDWQALRIPHFGSIGPGYGVGYTSFSAAAQKLDGTGTSSQDTSLEIVPMYLVGVLRIDVLANELKFPLVPYVKAGVGLGLWRAYSPNGTTSSNGVAGKGFTFGTHLAVGAAIQLDFLERDHARALDDSIGINHTYLFGELFWSNLRGLGQDNVMYVGAKAWTLGLAMEF